MFKEFRDPFGKEEIMEKIIMFKFIEKRVYFDKFYTVK